MAAQDKYGLISFTELLKQAVAKGSNASPVSIKAADLDNNFKHLRIIDEGTEKLTKRTSEGVELNFELEEYDAVKNGQLVKVKLLVKKKG